MRGTRWLTIGMLTILHGLSSLAAREIDGTLAEPLQAAELVFEGRVLRVEHAVPGLHDLDGARIPQPSVTFAVDHVRKGHAASTLRLRFFGGPEADSTLLASSPTTPSSASPLFEVGERVLVLVHANGAADGALVGWRFGRFRVFGEPLPVVLVEAVPEEYVQVVRRSIPTEHR